MAFSSSAELPGIGTLQNEDIVAYDSASGTWQFVFDGSDVGLSAFAIDALAVTASGELLLSFSVAGSIPNLVGGPDGAWVDDSDIVKFTPELLGVHTSGTFTFYLDGSDLGFETDGEDIDAIAVDSNGAVILSSQAAYSTSGISGTDRDLLKFTAAQFGETTSGVLEMIFRGSDVGLAGSASENIDAVAYADSDRVLLSTAGGFSVPGLVGSDDDIISFSVSQWGVPTTGTFALEQRLTSLGIDATENVAALEYVGTTNQVFADVQFRIEPLSGPGPLSVQCTAYRPDGLPLPEGIYAWTFDDMETSGPAGTHGSITHVFTESGAHVITLWITLAGLAGPVACINTETGTLQGRTFVWPRLGGQITDINGQPVGGVNVMTLVEPISTTTQPDGHYQLSVPFGWAGFVMAQSDLYTFDPPYHWVDASQSLVQELNFLATPHNEVTLSGVVRTFQGLPFGGVPIRATGSGASVNQDFLVTADSQGVYAVQVPAGWSGALETDDNYRLDPPGRLVQSAGDEGGQGDFTAYRQYYVALSGSDIGGGRIEFPFQSIQKATSEAKPGDMIWVRGGLYDLRVLPAYHQDTIYFRSSGRAGEPITLSGYPGETVTMMTSESKAIFDFSETWGHNTAGFGHYVFRNLRITGGRYGWIFRPSVPTTWRIGIDPVSDLWLSQIHDVVIEDCEVDGNGTVESGIYARYGGVRNLTVRRSRFHHTIGTEGTVDIGEWRDTDPGHLVPQSGSHNLLFEDCDFHHSQHQQSNGIVTQPCTFNVTLRRCRAWNNGKYGFAFKGSGNFRLDRCASWGNDSSQMYGRGFGGDDATPRPYFLNDFIFTNCIFVAPADQRGGSALNWRENAVMRAYHCTIVGLRDDVHGEAGGFAFLLGHQHNLPTTAVLRNCIVAGYSDSPAIRFYVSGGSPYLTNTRYEGGGNLLYSEPLNKFRYQSRNMRMLAEWQGYWAVGEPGGDDALNGPRASGADATSIMASPGFVAMDAAAAPLRKTWSDDVLDAANHCDFRLRSDSAAIGIGENLSGLGLPELLVDYLGNPRPASGAPTAGALQPLSVP